ncbi:MAG: helix-turn-helix domain-containing protein [Desulfobulbus sp.]|jgi:DNA-binding transcriptional regulator YiaG|uniref:helix-turn-helix domain-containing protein n=1 Tax=Desulfobulbus sp. TaxID=895 RepID=UPI00283DDF90|nr:helix-turn-helix domain-containing protein [Desulfobulbus sp.]MDR2551431.1 helix-turn-helix domain-containing protein [Desulfobulbus sp.]
MNPADIRNKFGVTQKVFARWCNTATGTIRKWESGEQAPSGPAWRLLDALLWMDNRGLLKDFLDDIEQEKTS